MTDHVAHVERVIVVLANSLLIYISADPQACNLSMATSDYSSSVTTSQSEVAYLESDTCGSCSMFIYRPQLWSQMITIKNTGPKFNYKVPSFSVIEVELSQAEIQVVKESGRVTTYDVFVKADPSLEKEVPFCLVVEHSCIVPVS